LTAATRAEHRSSRFVTDGQVYRPERAKLATNIRFRVIGIPFRRDDGGVGVELRIGDSDESLFEIEDDVDSALRESGTWIGLFERATASYEFNITRILSDRVAEFGSDCESEADHWMANPISHEYKWTDTNGVDRTLFVDGSAMADALRGVADVARAASGRRSDLILDGDYDWPERSMWQVALRLDDNRLRDLRRQRRQ